MMYRRSRFMMIVLGCGGLLGATLLIPNGEQVAVADTPAIVDLTSQETIATIDAMLGVGQSEAVEPAQVASTPRAAAITAPPAAATTPPDAKLQTAALTTPEPEVPAIDPSLHRDSIGRSAVNLRAGPSTSTAALTVLRPGQTVYTGANDGGWVEVTLEDGTTGWVYSRYLASVAAALPARAEQPAAKAEQPAAKSTTTRTARAVVRGSSDGALEGRTARIDARLTARAQPSGGSRSVFRTVPGERVKILDVRGNWLRIRTADGSSGWIERAG